LAHVVAEAEKAREEAVERTILANFSGHGLLDLAAYEKFLSGQLSDLELDEKQIDKARDILSQHPTPERIKR
jgi:tryptophan synthase beta chain